MNGLQPAIEKVALTPAEQRYFAPIWERYQEVQKDLNAVVDLFAASHEQELMRDKRGGWQLVRDGFVREAVPAQAETPTQTESAAQQTEQPIYSNGVVVDSL